MKTTTHLTSQVKIAVTPDGIAIESPFSSVNNEKFRSRGGVFDHKTGRWIFPDTAATRAMIEELYGNESELVIVALPSTRVDEIGKQWQTGGYVIATRFEQAGAVKTAPGVQLANGAWLPKGGTLTEPKVTADPNTVIHIVVRKSYADREGLTIIANDPPSRNILEDVNISDLIDELRRRGFDFGNDGPEGLTV